MGTQIEVVNKTTTKVTLGAGGWLLLVQLVLFVLKACKVIAWSWWLVFTPGWIALIIIILAIVFVLGVLAGTEA